MTGELLEMAATEWLLKCCVQSVCIESVFHREHYKHGQKVFQGTRVFTKELIYLLLQFRQVNHEKNCKRKII